MYFVAHDIMSRTARDRWEDESSSSWLQGDDMNEVRCPRLSITRGIS